VILKIGSTPHPARKAWIAASKKEKLSPIGRRMWYEYVIDCGGTLVQKDGNIAALNDQMQAWDAACSGNKDIVLYQANGTTPTHHRYLNSQTINGFRLERFAWLKGNPQIRDAYGSGVENYLKRTWQARFVGEVISAEHSLVDWYEWVEVIGDGGPIFRSKGAILGPVQFQQLQAFSPILLIQGGHAVGLTAPPSAAGPIFPAAIHREKTRIRRFTPKWATNRNTGFGVRWTYFMEYATAATVTPTAIP
jgi:hypothetical protein